MRIERDSGIFSKINKLSFQKLGKIQPQYIKLAYFILPLFEHFMKNP